MPSRRFGLCIRNPSRPRVRGEFEQRQRSGGGGFTGSVEVEGHHDLGPAILRGTYVGRAGQLCDQRQPEPKTGAVDPWLQAVTVVSNEDPEGAATHLGEDLDGPGSVLVPVG